MPQNNVVLDVRSFPAPAQRDMDSLDRVTDEQRTTREIEARFQRNVAANEVARIVIAMGLGPLWTTEDNK